MIDWEEIERDRRSFRRMEVMIWLTAVAVAVAFLKLFYDIASRMS